MVRGFVHLREAWYAKDRDGNVTLGEADLLDEVMVGIYDPEGGCEGEFAIRWCRDDLGARLEAFDDAWPVLARFADVLGAMHTCAVRGTTSVDDVLGMLRSCGVEDLTKRTREDK